MREFPTTSCSAHISHSGRPTANGERWPVDELRNIKTTPLDEAVRGKILYRNAQRLLKLPATVCARWGYTLRVNGLTSEAPPVTGLALEVKDLRVSYGPKRAVDGVSLDINEGEIFGLLGPNGAGKTSTLSAIEGLLKPTSGSILIRQVDVRAHPGLANSLIGVQLQSTSFQSELKISEIVKLYAGLYGVPLTKPAIFDRLTEITWATKRPGASASCQAGSRSACRCSSRQSTTLRSSCLTSRRQASTRRRGVSFGTESRASARAVAASF